MSSVIDVANEGSSSSPKKYDYIVVEFGAPGGSCKPLGTVEAQVLSSRWLEGNTVLWPKCSSNKKLYKLIKNHQEPHTDVKVWDVYEISRIVGRSDDYQKAQKILDESDFTESEDQILNQRPARKTRGKAPARYLEDSGDEEDGVNALQECSKEIRIDSVDDDHNSINGGDEGDGSVLNEPIIPPLVEIDLTNLGTSEVMRAITESLTGGHPENFQTRSQFSIVEVEEKGPTAEEANESDGDDISLHEAEMSDSETQGTHTANQKFGQEKDKHTQTCMLCSKCAMFLERIANILESKNRACDCHCERKSGNSQNELSNDSQCFASLPCKTHSEVLRFEEYLGKEDNMSAMVAKFRSFANTNLTTFVNSCLRKILTDELATKFNAKGSILEDGTRVKEEYTTKNFILLVMNTVVHSVPHIQTAPPATVPNVKNCLAGWFRNAKKRFDARSKGSRSTPRPESAASSGSQHSTVRSQSSQSIRRPDSAPLRPESTLVRPSAESHQRVEPHRGHHRTYSTSPNQGFNISRRSRFPSTYGYEGSQHFTQSPTNLRYSNNERTPDRNAWKNGPAPFRYSPYRSPRMYDRSFPIGDSLMSWEHPRYSSADPSQYNTPQKQNRGRAPPPRPNF